MSENIEYIQVNTPIRCTSVMRVVNERKKDGCLDFGKNKKRKKDWMVCVKQVVHTNQEITLDALGIEQKDYSLQTDEKQKGNTIDIEV